MIDDAQQLCPEPVRDGVTTSSTMQNWPRNVWWVAAHASEVSTVPVMRWILEMPVAIYRSEHGEPVVLHNQCPHRWAPLHLGSVYGDEIQCPYHGMRFGPSGQCTNVPTQEFTPPAIRVRSFPVAERYQFIWIWTGDPELSDPDLIPPELSYLDDPKWHSAWGYKSVEANFMQLKENVLDLTHFAFLHKSSLNISDWGKAPSVEEINGKITYRQIFNMSPLAATYADPAGKAEGKPVNRNSWGSLLSPAVNYAKVEMQDPSPEPGGLEHFTLAMTHLTTPVSAGKTHYYWSMARDHGAPFDLDATRRKADVVFGEDIAIAEATRAMACRSIHQEEAKEFSVLADEAAIRGRRFVQNLVESERRG